MDDLHITIGEGDMVIMENGVDEPLMISKDEILQVAIHARNTLANEVTDLKDEIAELVALVRHMSGYMPGMVVTADIGRCKTCGSGTSSGAHHICRKCLHERIHAFHKKYAGR